MIDIRTLKGLEYGKELYELVGKLYSYLTCPYETRALYAGSSRNP